MAFAAGILACGTTPIGRGALLLRDDSGAITTLEHPATRIASLIPATTEWLFAIGAGSAVIGRTAWCDYPTEALAIPSLGDGIAPNLEAIVASGPDLVLLYDSPSNANAAERLRSLGIATLLLRTDNLADLDRLLEVLGKATGHTASADSLRAWIQVELASATVPSPAVVPTIFILAWDQPPLTLGHGSFLSEIVERAGGRNLFAELETSSAVISIEAVVARDPDFVLISSADSLPGIAFRPEWRVVPAVRAQRFIRVHGSEFNRPGPRTPAAIRAMRRALLEASR